MALTRQVIVLGGREAHSTILTGIDAGEIAADGRLRRITGFWGELR